MLRSLDHASKSQVEKELALKPVFLFSRREGVMIKKMANPYSSTKLIDVGYIRPPPCSRSHALIWPTV